MKRPSKPKPYVGIDDSGAAKAILHYGAAPAAKAKPDSYESGDIQVFSGLEGIRRKPAMYLGDMDTAAFTCVREVADNTQDEFLAGRNTGCMIILVENNGVCNEVWVADSGSGIPVSNITLEQDGVARKVSALKAVVSMTHAGGKFTDSAYKVSSGTHGVGIKAVNAVSDIFEVWTHRPADGGWYHTSYSKGKEVSAVAKSKAPPKIKNAPGFVASKGTLVHFKLDESLFGTRSIDPKDVHDWGFMSSRLNPNFTVIVVNPDGTKVKYNEPDGLDALVRDIYLDATDGKGVEYASLEALYATGIQIPMGDSQMWLDVCLVSSPSVLGTFVEFYTNGVYNVDGGRHEEALWSAFHKALTDVAPARCKFTVQDLKDGCVGALNLKLNSPAFNNQAKEKLVDLRVKAPLHDFLCNEFANLFRAKKAFAKDLCIRASSIGAARETAMQGRKALLTLKKSTTVKPSKFAATTGKLPADRTELFLVEGESAGGSAKDARFRDFQSVLPLKGKPLNAYKAADTKVIISQEVMNIFNCMGYIPDGKTKPNMFGKLILLSDSDVDGYHINALVLALIQKYVPELFEEGKVFVVDTRHCKLYGLGRKGMYYFGRTSDAVHAAAKKAGDAIVGKTSYLKGWGELNPAGLRIAAMDPSTRKLIKVTGATKAQMDDFQRLMGNDPAFRKEMLGI